jgi:hypothetical protein
VLLRFACHHHARCTSPGALPHQFPWHDQVDATDLDAFWATVMARMQAGGAAAAAHHEEEL